MRETETQMAIVPPTLVIKYKLPKGTNKKRGLDLMKRQDPTLLCTVNIKAKSPLIQGKAEVVVPGN